MPDATRMSLNLGSGDEHPRVMLGTRAALALAGPANAASSQVEFRNQATRTKLITRSSPWLC